LLGFSASAAAVSAADNTLASSSSSSNSVAASWWAVLLGVVALMVCAIGLAWVLGGHCKRSVKLDNAVQLTEPRETA
jgi:hypothetical protein